MILAPTSCPEAQIRYGFPKSGSYWIDVDGSDSTAMEYVECDMSTVPAATLFSHDKQDIWMESKGYSKHADHNQEISYLPSSSDLV